MNTFLQNKLIKQSYQAFLNKCRAIILIYSDDNSYEVLKKDSLFTKYIKEKGSLRDLYQSLFLQNRRMDSTLPNENNSFVDIQRFKQDNYHDYLTLSAESTSVFLEYRILLLEENVSVLYFLDSAEKKTTPVDNTFSILSHELRTPLTAILGLNEIILQNSLEPQTLNCARDIQNTGNWLLQMTDTFLDYYRLQADKIELFPSIYDVKTLLHDIKTVALVLTKNKNLSLEWTGDENLPPYLYGDDLRIKQILINLISNAVKYTSCGSVSLHFSFQEKKTQQGLLTIQVSDTGKGIRSKDIKHLFCAFERIEESSIREISGFGLGMHIVASLLKKMGSQLEINSEYGKGTTFSFSLIQDIPSSEQKTSFLSLQKEDLSSVNSLFTGKKILIVDDMKINLYIMSELLKKTGAEITTLSSGTEVLKLAETTNFDLIFLDHLMPEMDGVHILHKIRQLSNYYQTVPIIALTANVTANSRDFYVKNGFSDFLEKPFNSQTLLSCLKKYFI